MRHYELMIILDPNLEEKTVQGRHSTSFLKGRDRWWPARSRRSTSGASAAFAYQIQKKSEGFYAVVGPDGGSRASVLELDRQLNLNEDHPADQGPRGPRTTEPWPLSPTSRIR